MREFQASSLTPCTGDRLWPDYTLREEPTEHERLNIAAKGPHLLYWNSALSFAPRARERKWSSLGPGVQEGRGTWSGSIREERQILRLVAETRIRAC